MPTKDYSKFKGILPYASEMFGAYRPMVGWASKRKHDRIINAEASALAPFLTELLPNYVSGNAYVGPEVLGAFTGAAYLPDAKFLVSAGIGQPADGPILQPASFDEGTFFLPAVQKWILEKRGPLGAPPDANTWKDVLTLDSIKKVYGKYSRNDDGTDASVGMIKNWVEWSNRFQATEQGEFPPQRPGEADEDFQKRKQVFDQQIMELCYGILDRESKIAAVLLDLVRTEAVETLTNLFYTKSRTNEELERKIRAFQRRLTDPFLEFDPRDQLQGVSVSPLGISHLFRQYFFEFDTFLGPSVGHIWLTPGSTVELIESSTRKVITERSYEEQFETRTQIETIDNRKEDISEAIKQDNREDTKLGFSTTVNQSWPSGSLTATGSLNVDKTQQMAREHIQKSMREQSSKLSKEIRNQYKTTFKTVTETSDVSSKRYVLSNPSDTNLQNYEMRRKMRQVGVQVQDVGTYLCWETFVDDPGKSLGLANLVHIAKPPDTTPVPNPALIPVPERKSDVPFDVKVSWSFGDRRQRPTSPQGIPLGRRQMSIDIPDGYRVEIPVGTVFQLQCMSAAGEGAEDFRQHQYLAVYSGGRDLDIGLSWGPGGLKWDGKVNIDLRGTIALVPTEERLRDINIQNTAIIKNAEASARLAEVKASETAFYAAAQERIELAAAVKKRNFEDLREEERIVVYRELIADLMAKDSSTGLDNYLLISDEQRHTFATVLNAIFDIDKMLYFVAPEWWKPRVRSGLNVGSLNGDVQPFKAEQVVSWSDKEIRDDNYYITSKSEPARLGSSLGWLLQLDGDNHRNRFLNAPWVRAVIPIRPGKEEAAIAWLQRANVEGIEGLDQKYAAQPGEADEIKQGLHDAGYTASEEPTVEDAIRYLCVRVQEKHQEGVTEQLFPDRTGIDDGDKVWATPIDKVYEHGFYPLDRSFRASPSEEPVDSTSTNFQILSQWTEILPTDQIVPVVVQYDPSTGRQIRPDDEP
ncbi:hypothetical protein ACWECW_18445 [Rhodococcus ruber]